jgi:hypothetical protein
MLFLPFIFATGGVEHHYQIRKAVFFISKNSKAIPGVSFTVVG